MNVTYTFTTTALCPVDGATDVYQVEIGSNEAIPVEKIIRVADWYRSREIFQEDLAIRFAVELPDTLVKITGWHSGVKVVSEA